jgi:acyl-CoA reductase-like NAD-dependent aldehyde dehydrogenase
MTTTSIPLSSLSDRVQAARSAQRNWEQRPLRHRLKAVRAFRNRLVSQADALTAAVHDDFGKPPVETLAGDILPLADACQFLEKEAERLLQPRSVPNRLRPLWLWGQNDTVYRRPRGIVGIIGTWNYPLFLNGVQILQALTAGNAVLWKPSEVSPASAVILHQQLLESGFPSELIQRLDATREAGAALVDADIQHVVFTGSAATGRRIAAHLGERLISSTMELSGCDALFVLDDADVALAARAAFFGATLNAGQTCLAVRRAFVLRAVYDDFCQHLTRLAADLTPRTLALGSQVHQAERLVNNALASGARLLSPPLAAPANGKIDRLQPAIVADANGRMDICREASFAPILAIVPCASETDALLESEYCSYGLGASIFTTNIRRAQSLAQQLRTGVVTVNDVIVSTAHPATPLGGCRDSGWGVTQGQEGLLEMTVPQVISTRTDHFRPHYDLVDPQLTAQQTELVRGLMESSHGTTLGQRWSGWRRLLRMLWNSGKK